MVEAPHPIPAMPSSRPIRAAVHVLACTGVLAAYGCAGPSAGPAGESPVAGATVHPASSTSSGDIRVTIVQLNDLYEITPVGGGRWGGPARVATLLRRLEARNPNTLALIAGDFFSPSALGTARVDGERLAGRQMVAVLNVMGLDYATFGNHEFDLDEAGFRDRLAESEFEWFSSNVRDGAGRPLPGVDDFELLRFVGSGGDTLRLGLVGLTYGGTAPDYVSLSDAIDEARRVVDLLADSTQALLAVTHLTMAADIALAESVPELDLIMGGHDHENWMARRGPDLTPIAKADANVRTVWIHDLRWDPRTRTLDIESRLMPITDDIPDDPATQAEVERWLEAGWAGFRAAGFEPESLVATVPESLDGLETSVRNRPTALTRLITAGMLAEAPEARVAILNGGSIRIDDVIPPGPVTQYDIIRALPFGGAVVEVEMTGALLVRILDQGRANVGGGGYLHTAGVVEAGSAWEVDGALVDPDRRYRVVVADFLLSGREQGLGFLSRDTPGLLVLQERRDVRQVLIDELRRSYGGAR
jgi:5'-nucleotidase / UDP-sugar diphosphatase